MENKIVPEMLQMIGQAVPEEVSIAISDGTQYLYYQPSSNIDLKISPGDQVPIGSATHKALMERGKSDIRWRAAFLACRTTVCRCRCSAGRGHGLYYRHLSFAKRSAG